MLSMNPDYEIYKNYDDNVKREIAVGHSDILISPAVENSTSLSSAN